MPAELVTNDTALAVDDELDIVKLMNCTVAEVQLNKLIEGVAGTIIVLMVELPAIVIPAAVIAIGPPELSSANIPAPI